MYPNNKQMEDILLVFIFYLVLHMQFLKSSCSIFCVSHNYLVVLSPKYLLVYSRHSQSVLLILFSRVVI